MKDDSLPVARKKWHDYILCDYKYFWDVYSHKINYRTLTDLEVVKLHDIYEIVYFINPEGIRVTLKKMMILILWLIIFIRDS